jgi:hypothetical protein
MPKPFFGYSCDNCDMPFVTGDDSDEADCKDCRTTVAIRELTEVIHSLFCPFRGEEE